MAHHQRVRSFRLHPESLAYQSTTLLLPPMPEYLGPHMRAHHHSMFATCDGVLLSTPECYDALSIIGARAWMAETARGLYAVGPTLSAGAYAVENELMQADRGTEVRDFVSRVLKSHGPRSLLHVRCASELVRSCFRLAWLS